MAFAACSMPYFDRFEKQTVYLWAEHRVSCRPGIPWASTPLVAAALVPALCLTVLPHRLSYVVSTFP